jgi:hypothetical protein
MAQLTGSDWSAVGMHSCSTRRSSPQRGQGMSVERTRSLSCTTARLVLTSGPTCDHPRARPLAALLPMPNRRTVAPPVNDDGSPDARIPDDPLIAHPSEGARPDEDESYPGSAGLERHAGHDRRHTVDGARGRATVRARGRSRRAAAAGRGGPVIGRHRLPEDWQPERSRSWTSAAGPTSLSGPPRPRPGCAWCGSSAVTTASSCLRPSPTNRRDGPPGGPLSASCPPPASSTAPERNSRG